MRLSGHRDTLVRLENSLFDLLRRIDRLRAVGVTIPQRERDALAKMYRALGDQIAEYENHDTTWKPERIPTRRKQGEA